MKLIPVNGSPLKFIGYDAETKTLRTVFSSGNAFDHAPVPQSAYSALCEADDVQRHYARHIRAKYPCSQLKPGWQERECA